MTTCAGRRAGTLWAADTPAVIFAGRPSSGANTAV